MVGGGRDRYCAAVGGDHCCVNVVCVCVCVCVIIITVFNNI